MLIDISLEELKVIEYSIISAMYSENRHLEDTFVNKIQNLRRESFINNFQNDKDTQSLLFPYTYLVRYNYDNGTINEEREAICLAFDAEDAKRIVICKEEKYSDDSVVVESVTKFQDGEIFSRECRNG